MNEKIERSIVKHFYIQNKDNELSLYHRRNGRDC